MFTLRSGSAEFPPVFGFKEEAELFLAFGARGGRWKMKESSAGEIISLLHGLCSGFDDIALGPAPEANSCLT